MMPPSHPLDDALAAIDRFQRLKAGKPLDSFDPLPGPRDGDDADRLAWAIRWLVMELMARTGELRDTPAGAGLDYLRYAVEELAKLSPRQQEED